VATAATACSWNRTRRVRHFDRGPIVDPHDWSSGFISRTDVADFLVKQINDVSLFHKTPALTGT
jgi:hypothetical protein